MGKRIYLDLEYLYPGMTRESGRPGEHETRQIVQIAAILFDTEKKQELASFDQLVLPEFDNVLPSFFSELTAITQKDVEIHGIKLSEALSKFEDFCGNYEIWTFDKDWNVLVQNYNYIQRPFIFKDKPFLRVKERLADWGIDPNKYSSGTLYQAVGLDMKGHVHNALHDVRSMAAAVAVLE